MKGQPSLLVFVALTRLIFAGVFATSPGMQGGGSSLAGQFYIQALFMYKFVDPELNATYAVSSSGTGRANLLSTQFVYAGTDADFSTSDYASHPGIQVYPTIAAPVVVIYNYPGLNWPLEVLILNRDVTAMIFAGAITDWSDSRITSTQSASVAAKMTTSHPITVVARSGSSGTTTIFTTSLAKFDSSWSWGSVGIWPSTPASTVFTSTNSQAASMVTTTPYALSYVVLYEAKQANVSYADMRNKAGNVVSASADSTWYAMMEFGAQFSNRFTATICDGSSSYVWPLAGYTYLALNTSQFDPTYNCIGFQRLIPFWKWVFQSKQVSALAEAYGFAVIPDKIRDNAIKKLEATKCNNELILPSVQFATYTVVGTSVLQGLYQLYMLAHGLVLPTVQFVYRSEDIDSTAWLLLSNGDAAVALLDHHWSYQSNIDPTTFRANYQSQPAVLASVVPLFKLSAIGTNVLVLTLPVLAKIFLGTISTWNDVEIQALNPTFAGLLPSSSIHVVVRSDPTGVTEILTRALSSTSASFASSIGVLSTSSGTLSWTGSSAVLTFVSSAAAMSAQLDTVDGTLGYDVYSALNTGTPVSLQLNSNEIVRISTGAARACLASLSATNLNASISDDIPINLNNVQAAGCWPLTNVTYAVTSKSFTSSNIEPGKDVLSFVAWTYGSGSMDMAAESYFMARMTDSVNLQILQRLNTISYQGYSVLDPPPDCNSTYWSYSVSACSPTTNTRLVVYSYTSLCKAGQSLPSTVELECEYIEYGYGAAVAFAILGSLGIITSCAFGGYIYIKRDTPVFKAAQPVFMFLFCVGAAIVFSVLFVLPGENTDAACTARIWLFEVGCVVMFSNLFLKTYRIHKIMNNPKLRRVRVKEKDTLKQICGLVSVTLILLLLWVTIDPSKSTYIPHMEVGVGLVSRRVCIGGDQFNYMLLAYKGLLLTFGCTISFQTRNYTGRFHEAKYIFLSIYNVALVGTLLLLLTFAASMTPKGLYLLKSAGLLWVIASSLCIMIIPKIMAIKGGLTDLTANSSHGTTATHHQQHRHLLDQSPVSLSKVRPMSVDSEASLHPFPSSNDWTVSSPKTPMTFPADYNVEPLDTPSAQSTPSHLLGKRGLEAKYFLEH
eukprot:GILJ01004321.1.p1 GENE.GILJ01004321.1~~GILJ01004321.1.p1  ORF type:complete len:1119 (-),score=95.26 GILJ01004321.1:206-3562(-)